MLLKLNTSLQNFEKCSNIMLHESTSRGGDELLLSDGQTDKGNLIVAFRNFANSTKSLT